MRDLRELVQEMDRLVVAMKAVIAEGQAAASTVRKEVNKYEAFREKVLTYAESDEAKRIIDERGSLGVDSIMKHFGQPTYKEAKEQDRMDEYFNAIEKVKGVLQSAGWQEKKVDKGGYVIRGWVPDPLPFR